MRSATVRLTFLFETETPESRHQEVRELLGRTDKELDRARVRLILERDAAAKI